jgi:hypothetical protein
LDSSHITEQDKITEESDEDIVKTVRERPSDSPEKKKEDKMNKFIQSRLMRPHTAVRNAKKFDRK